MKQYCYVILNNAGHSWPVQTPPPDGEAPKEQPGSVLPQLLQEGWEPIRETAMGGGTSPLAHSLILLERSLKVERPVKAKAGRRAKG